jgi:hypothetical protein
MKCTLTKLPRPEETAKQWTILDLTEVSSEKLLLGPEIEMERSDCTESAMMSSLVMLLTLSEENSRKAEQVLTGLQVL